MAEEVKLQVGDVVYLNSSGIKITIENIKVDTQSAECVWISNDNIVHRDTFPLACLRRVPQ